MKQTTSSLSTLFILILITSVLGAAFTMNQQFSSTEVSAYRNGRASSSGSK